MALEETNIYSIEEIINNTRCECGQTRCRHVAYCSLASNAGLSISVLNKLAQALHSLTHSLSLSSHGPSIRIHYSYPYTPPYPLI